MSDDQKILKRWARQAQRAGWSIVPTGSGHWKWVRPDGTVGTITPHSPGRGRSLHNVRADLKRAGLVVR